MLADLLSALRPVNRKVDRLFLCHETSPEVCLCKVRAQEQRVLYEGGSVFNTGFVPKTKGHSNPEALASQPLAFAGENGVHQALGEALCLGPFSDGEPMKFELLLDSLR